MNRILAAAIMVILLFLSARSVFVPRANAATIVVPDDYPTIQEAINNASEGSTIYIKSGSFNENIVINKTLTVLGENRERTVINCFSTSQCGVFVTANNSVMSNFTVQNGFFGFLLSNVSSVIVREVDLNDCRYGISLRYSSDNTVSDCNMLFNHAGSQTGFEIILDSSRNSICRNDIEPSALFSEEGIIIGKAFNNTISGNSIRGRRYGLYISSESADNIFEGNIVENCDYGISAFDTKDKFYHNNFINNRVQVYPWLIAEDNVWDSGYPSGGNYWSDYFGEDLYHGASQSETGSDGIGDSFYYGDRYPLMKSFPWGAHDVGVTHVGRVYELQPEILSDVFPLKTVIGQNLSLRFDVLVMNYGDYPETLDLAVYANETVCGNILGVALGSKNSTILDVLWNTSGFAFGNYALSLYLEPVAGEIDVKDNNYTRSLYGEVYVIVSVVGDVNGDCRVDILDVGYAARRFRDSAADYFWIANPDINEDGNIDIRDISTIARHFGEHCP